TVYHGPTPDAVLSAGDVLAVDEAGMLDQDTALALLTVAEEHDARVALIGDRHQLPAVGRGGVLEHAHRWVDPAALVQLDTVHRRHTTLGRDGQRLGGGDTGGTRRNDHVLGVANRDTWTVTHVHADGALTVRRANAGVRGDARNRMGDAGVTLPSSYVCEHVE